MNKLFKKIEIFVIVVVIAVIGIVYAFQHEPNQEKLANTTPENSITELTEAQNELDQPAPETSIVYEGVDGKTAMELLQATHQVTIKSYDFGDFVTSINGITPDFNQFWAMYVNGQQAQVGASQYVTKNGESIKWQIDQIQ